MEWFRAHHGISNDVKISLIADRIGAKRCEVGWVWMILLDHASQNSEDRGNVGALLPEEISFMSGVPEERVLQIIEAFRDRKMLSESGRLSNWEKRQPERDPTNAERQRRYRERQREVTQEQHNVTHAPLRNALHNTDREEKNREEKKEKPTHTAAQTAAELVLFPDPPQEKPDTERWFFDWWAIYWRKVAVQDARKAFTKKVKSREVFDLVMVATRKQTPEMMSREPDKRPHGATWINGERWKDEAPPPSNGQAAPSSAKKGVVEQTKELIGRRIQESGRPW